MSCGACCIAPSITSFIPGMPDGKPAGVPCIQLDEKFGCRLWLNPLRPKVCGQFAPEASICGQNRVEALGNIQYLEEHT